MLLFVLLGETGVRAFTLFPAPSPFKRPALRRHAVSSLRAEQQLDTAAVREAVQRTASLPFDDPSKVRVVVAGATGYIGKFVVREFVNQGFQTVAFVRPGATVREDLFEGAEIRHGQATDLDDIRQNAFGDEQVDVVVSCLASRSGTKSDSWAVDYQATKNMLDVAVEKGAKHFILLSAFCVNIPKLQFQHAKVRSSPSGGPLLRCQEGQSGIHAGRQPSRQAGRRAGRQTGMRAGGQAGGQAERKTSR